MEKATANVTADSHEPDGENSSATSIIKTQLGTPATRAGIIEKLITAGFMTRSKKQLLPTEKGINLIKVVL